MPRTKKEATEEKTTKKKTIKKVTKKTVRKAEEKSTTEKEDKLAKLKAKAEALAAGIETKEIDVSKEIKKEQKPGALAPIEDYLKSSMHLGTRAITPDMRPYVYKRRADSLAVFNTELLDDKLKEGVEYLAQYPPEEIVVVCKRDAGEKAARLFSKVTGITVFVKNYPAGILTNPNLDTFMEKELLLICDPWTDKAALADAKRIKMPVMAICDTNNYTMNIDKIIPGNNKSAKSLGFIFYLLAKNYVKLRKIDAEMPEISEWVENWDTLTPPK
ncbi:MAG: 30S ribosomal protein S2 [Nanoarchaeota archaeon]|nr:30S ribosomal protein S2 [Nanoarchaeota archaeon]MBU0977231.1 30S ribosomal protein S2 [Nanoarchaeota archaeon]